MHARVFPSSKVCRVIWIDATKTWYLWKRAMPFLHKHQYCCSITPDCGTFLSWAWSGISYVCLQYFNCAFSCQSVWNIPNRALSLLVFSISCGALPGMEPATIFSQSTTYQYLARSSLSYSIGTQQEQFAIQQKQNACLLLKIEVKGFWKSSIAMAERFASVLLRSVTW